MFNIYRDKYIGIIERTDKMSENFLASKIGSASVNGVKIDRGGGQKPQTTAETSADYTGNLKIGDEFINSSKKAGVQERQARQNALKETEYNKVASSTASKVYEKVASSITSLFTGSKGSKINQKANEDFAYFDSSSDDESGYADLKYFAQTMGNKHITSTIKEYETLKKLLGVSNEEVFANY